MNDINVQVPRNYILQGPAIIRIKEEDIPYTFFSSDLHFNHANILNFTQRGTIWNNTDEMFTGLMSNVTLGKLVPAMAKAETAGTSVRYIHCGDLIFGSKRQSVDMLKKIQSYISPYVSSVYAVFGNHDIDNILRYHDMIPCMSYQNTDRFCDPKWFWNNVYVVEVYRDTKCILRFTVSHFPMDEYYGSFNIHGHLHSEPIVSETANNKDIIMKYRSTGRHFDCGVDNNNYMPVSLADVLEGKTSIKIDEISSLKKIVFKYHRDDD